MSALLLRGFASAARSGFVLFVLVGSSLAQVEENKMSCTGPVLLCGNHRWVVMVSPYLAQVEEHIMSVLHNK